jgi:hypothetical protein
MAEVHTTQSPHARITLLNFGAHWKLDDTLTLLIAAGREFGTASDERRQRWPMSGSRSRDRGYLGRAQRAAATINVQAA